MILFSNSTFFLFFFFFFFFFQIILRTRLRCRLSKEKKNDPFFQMNKINSMGVCVLVLFCREGGKGKERKGKERKLCGVFYEIVFCQE